MELSLPLGVLVFLAFFSAIGIAQVLLWWGSFKRKREVKLFPQQRKRGVKLFLQRGSNLYPPWFFDWKKGDFDNLYHEIENLSARVKTLERGKTLEKEETSKSAFVEQPAPQTPPSPKRHIGKSVNFEIGDTR